MDIKNIWKPAAVYVGILVFFMVLAYAYAPEALSGKVVNQSDISGWMGMTHEVSEYNAAHPDDKTQWTNSMFGGMPTVAMYDDFGGDWTSPLYKTLMKIAARPVNFFLISLIGAFLMMLAFGVNKWLAVAGAIAVTFCSYNLQIIQVGHNTKMQAIAFMPWVIAGLVFTYRSALAGCLGKAAADSAEKGGKPAASAIKGGRAGETEGGKADATKVDKAGETVSSKAGFWADWKSWLPKTVLGAVLFSVAVSFQIKANHPQISYYLAIIVLIYAIALLIQACASKKRSDALGRFFTASGLLLVIGLVGIGTNCNKLIPTYEYSKYTMRGGSELSSDSDTHNDKGLDLAYATAWSYGIEETPNLLIANFNGGASSGELGKDSQTYDLLRRAGQPNLNSVMKALPLYWGPQPFTAGPMYMGAITVFLFILGLCLCEGKEKWWLAVAVVIAVFLAWGSHFMWFTRLWFKFAPMYNKFRTVSMALVILQVALPVLGFIVLDKILKNSYDRKKLLRGTGIALAITGGFCLICILFPGIAGPFTGAVDSGQPDILIQALAADRRHLLVSDAWRSLSLIILTVILIWFLFGRKNQYSNGARTGILAIVLCAMMVFDLWGIGKRYLNDDHFVNKRDFTTGQFAERAVDKMIKEDPDPDYRVLDISVNTFNDSHPSYHHKCIGGYSPVKLQRYQDLIEKYISGEINTFIRTVNASATISEVQDNLPYLPVVSMLNGKYIIIGDDYVPVTNKYAFGNAWFVDDFVDAATPDEEIALLRSVDLHSSAVIGADFKDAVAGVRGGVAAQSANGVAARPADSLADEATARAAEGSADEAAAQSAARAAEGSANEAAAGAAGGEAGEATAVSADYVTLTQYAPNELHYHYASSSERAVIFSEIYYPDGWTLHYRPAGNGATTTDDPELTLFRANWILRGAVLPEGEGELIMRYDPQNYRTGAALSRASSITLLLLLLLSILGSARLTRRQ